VKYREFVRGRLGLKLIPFVGLIALLRLAACGSGVDEVTVQLDPEEGFDQSGTATLVSKGIRTEVTINVSPGPAANDPQPIHIHFGKCGPNLGEVDNSLSDVVQGRSVTVVDASISQLSDGNHTFNLHKSYPEIRLYSSCGDIPQR